MKKTHGILSPKKRFADHLCFQPSSQSRPPVRDAPPPPTLHSHSLVGGLTREPPGGIYRLPLQPLALTDRRVSRQRASRNSAMAGRDRGIIILA